MRGWTQPEGQGGALVLTGTRAELEKLSESIMAVAVSKERDVRQLDQEQANDLAGVEVYFEQEREQLLIWRDAERLLVSGGPTVLDVFAHNVHFLARPDLFPGSLGDHLHCEPFSDGTGTYAKESIPLILERI